MKLLVDAKQVNVHGSHVMVETISSIGWKSIEFPLDKVHLHLYRQKSFSLLSVLYKL